MFDARVERRDRDTQTVQVGGACENDFGAAQIGVRCDAEGEVVFVIGAVHGQAVELRILRDYQVDIRRLVIGEMQFIGRHHRGRLQRQRRLRPTDHGRQRQFVAGGGGAHERTHAGRLDGAGDIIDEIVQIRVVTGGGTNNSKRNKRFTVDAQRQRRVICQLAVRRGCCTAH